MATTRMLVDATHPEETRVVVTSGNRLEEFDFESANRRQLRGNIYLAKVTRVEPSLQAAFVEYGGNRHGFLAFSEIHPDYYQIPVADREALLADQAQDDMTDDHADQAPRDATQDSDGEDREDGDNQAAPDSDQTVEQVGGGDALEEMPERRKSPAKRYKIQEVIKRRQVMLIQVVKEERGNKGAALTSYLSLAGRYSVLMPNTARGGGISRKITSASDRKRLKEIANELQVPEGMGIILRTAGASRTKAEVKRDYEYLMRLWENVRGLTLSSSAPSLVYEEGSLIKRTIRDLYNKDINEVWVAGDDAYREAKDFMRMIMPSHAKNVQAYKDDQQIFSKYNVESQLDSMFSPQVTLPSGGYIVINPTEALVSIDVNSGRATKEHNIEDTALQTNLEAADEVARQLRLRDLAGLVVIDFIDMSEKRSNRNVERRLKDALRYDRARIQVGRISHFGLLEMSRQRMRFGVLESSSHVCPTCAGAGIVRSVESVALMVMRAIEDHVLRKPGASINVKLPSAAALYLLNAKRTSLIDLENKYSLSITISADDKLTGSNFNIERGETRPANQSKTRAPISANLADMDAMDAETDNSDTSDDAEEQQQPRRRRRGGRNRNRRDNGGEDTTRDNASGSSDSTEESASQSRPSNDGDESTNDDEPRKRRRRGRRGGRRNRRTGGDGDGENQQTGENSERADVSAEAADTPTPETVSEAPTEPAVMTNDADSSTDAAAQEAVEAPKKRARRPRKKAVETDADTKGDDVVAAPAEDSEAPKAAAKKPAARKPRAKKDTSKVKNESDAPVEEKASEPEKTKAQPTRRSRKTSLVPDEGIIVTSSTADPEPEPDKKQKKAGWWQRGFLGQ